MAITIGKRKFKKKHFKKAFLIAIYSIVAITTVAGMASSAFMSR